MESVVPRVKEASVVPFQMKREGWRGCLPEAIWLVKARGLDSRGVSSLLAGGGSSNRKVCV